MSEQEARGKAEQLTRVWTQGQTVDWSWNMDEVDDSEFTFRAMMSGEVRFQCWYKRDIGHWVFHLSMYPEDLSSCSLYCNSVAHHIVCRPNGLSLQAIHNREQFVAQWEEMFRRGCWLCGCPIECNAHERIEWMLWLQEKEAA